MELSSFFHQLSKKYVASLLSLTCFKNGECAWHSGWVGGVRDHQNSVANVLDDEAFIEAAIEVGELELK